MPEFSPVRSRPIALSKSTESQVYLLFALAMAFTVLGVFAGMAYATMLLQSGIAIFLVIAELGIVFTSRLWMDRSPLNIILFGLFPLLSGITITPYLLLVLTGYANGGAILLNALIATSLMSLAACVAAFALPVNLSGLGRGLFFAIIGLVVMGLLQVFIPSLRSTQFELILSGAGVVIFGVFTAYDLQRITAMGRSGANPFLLALSLYLDIFNLFLYILRFMTALSGQRR